MNVFEPLSGLEVSKMLFDFCTSIIEDATCILGRCVSFVSRAAFHVASGIQCPPGLEILLPDGKESSQGSRTRPGSPTKRRSRRGIVSGNVLVATLWPCLACSRTQRKTQAIGSASWAIICVWGMPTSRDQHRSPVLAASFRSTDELAKDV